MNYIHMLSKLGMGSAHPGGFEATLRMLKNYPIQPGTAFWRWGAELAEPHAIFRRWGIK